MGYILISATAVIFFKKLVPCSTHVINHHGHVQLQIITYDIFLHAGDQMIFLILNLVEVIGLVLTFKPFLAVPKQYDFK